MDTVTFTYPVQAEKGQSQATITARPQRGRDVLDAHGPLLHDLVNSLLAARGAALSSLDDSEWHRLAWFLMAYFRSEVDGSLPFVWPDRKADGTALAAAYEALIDGPADLVQAWRDALDRADRARPDPNESSAAIKS